MKAKLNFGSAGVLHTLTAGDLIKLLSKHDPSTPVVISAGYGYDAMDDEATITDATEKVEKGLVCYNEEEGLKEFNPAFYEEEDAEAAVKIPCLFLRAVNPIEDGE